MQDYNYLATNCFEITVEIGCLKFPPANRLSRIWDDNKEALIGFMERVRNKGVAEGDGGTCLQSNRGGKGGGGRKLDRERRKGEGRASL